ncbi:unnamed protein product [Sphagnum balticum]
MEEELRCQSIIYVKMLEKHNKEKIVVRAPPPYVPIKYFVSSLNTFFGNHLVRRLRNDHIHADNPNRIIGTVVVGRSSYAVPQGVRKVIEVESRLSSKDVKDIDVLTLNLRMKPSMVFAKIEEEEAAVEQEEGNGSGKTYHSGRLAEKYYLPHIHIRGVIEEVKELKNEFGEEIRNFLNEKREAEVQAKQGEWE